MLVIVLQGFGHFLNLLELLHKFYKESRVVIFFLVVRYDGRSLRLYWWRVNLVRCLMEYG